MSEPKTTLAERLKRLRLAKGHATAREFAKLIGISENRYSRYERGEAVPKLDLVWAICDALGITPNELYGWNPTATQPTRETGSQARHSPGFSEDGSSTSSANRGFGPSNQEVPGRLVAQSAIDLAAWRLASVLADSAQPQLAQDGPAAAGVRPGTMRTTADLFLKIKSDPFETLARLLQSPELQGRPPDVEARISAEIQSFLAALEGAGRPAADS